MQERETRQVGAVAGVSEIPGPRPVEGKPGQPVLKLALLMMFAGLGGVLGYLVAGKGMEVIGGAARASGWSRGWLLSMIVVMFVVSWFLTTLVHEGGHAIAGILTGRRLYVFSVGPIWIQRMTDGVRVRWKRLSRSVGGWVLASGGDETVRGWRYAAFLLGGVVANVVVGVPLVLLWQEESLGLEVRSFGLVAGSLQLLTALLNLIPFRVGGGIQTDGMALWRQLSGQRDRREEAVLLAVHALMGGIRPRDWPASVVAQMLGGEDAWEGVVDRGGSVPSQSGSVPSQGGSVQGSGGAVQDRGERVHSDMLLYMHAMDVGELDLARVRLKRVLERYDRLPEVSRGGFAPEVAWFVARVDGDVVRARQWMVEAKGAMLEKHDVKLAEGGIACLEGRWEDARRLADEAELAMRHPVMVANEDVRDRVNELRRWVETASGARAGEGNGSK